MAVATITGFWGLAFLLIVTPGADWAYTITAGLRQRNVLPAVGGLIAGHTLLVLLVAAGVGALVTASPPVLTALTVLGALYLLWLGAGMVRRPATPEGGAAQACSWQGQFLRGAGVSGLNPKALLLLVTLLPQFVRASSAWPVSVQILVLGGIHVVTCASVYLLVGLGARRVLGTRPHAARVVVRVSGVIVVVIGLVLLGERIASMLAIL